MKQVIIEGVGMLRLRHPAIGQICRNLERHHGRSGLVPIRGLRLLMLLLLLLHVVLLLLRQHGMRSSIGGIFVVKVGRVKRVRRRGG